METLGGTFDLGFALVRGEIRLGFLLYRSLGGWGCRYERVQNFGRKTLQMAHSRTAPVPVSAVLVPKVYCRVYLGWYRYHFANATFSWLGPVPISVVPVPLYKNF